MERTISIENATIDMLLASGAMRVALPCLAHAEKITEKKCCKNKVRKERTVDYQQAKKCVGAADRSSLASVKKFLNADRLRVSYMVRRNRVSKLL